MKDHIVIPLSNYNNRALYRAQVCSTSPETAKQANPQQGRCFIGISLDNPNFVATKLCSIIDWASNHYPDCIFLLADSVHRLTLQIRKNLAPEQSYQHALALGDYYMRLHGHLFFHSKTGAPLQVLRGSDIDQSLQVKHHLDALTLQFEENATFSAAVKGFATHFIARSSEHRETNEALSRRIHCACLYTLEELAETCYMVEQGYSTLIYPGSLAIFEQIANGHFTGLPSELSRLTNIGLRLKRRGQKQTTQAPFARELVLS